MRHILTPLIAFHWMAVFALLAMVSTLDPEHGILAALSLLGAAPTPDAILSGGGPLAAAFFSFAFAVAGVLFLPVALAPGYLATMERAGYDPFRTAIDVPQWRRQWMLWRAARRYAGVMRG